MATASRHHDKGQLVSVFGFVISPNNDCKRPEACMINSHDLSDWAVCMDGYHAEGGFEAPYKYVERQRLLTISLRFLKEVWGMGTCEPLTIDNLQRAAETVGKLRYPEAKEVRISLNQRTWLTGYRNPPSGWVGLAE